MKKIIKRLFNNMGIDIVRYDRRAVKEQGQLNGPENYYVTEGKRFQWLKEYNFKTIIDVGANEGQFAGKISTIFPEAQIHCFEPLQQDFDNLKNNFRGRSNVSVYNFGLSDVNQEKQIFRNEYSPSSSLLEMLDLHKSNFDYAVKVEPETIQLKVLDEVLPRPLPRPLLIKIDVQGYEMYVLKGAENVIQQADVCIIETSFYPLYNGQPLFEDIYHYFLQRGFRYAGNVEQLMAPSDNKVLQADAVFIKR
jgi:FkbM family methyltransferase